MPVADSDRRGEGRKPRSFLTQAKPARQRVLQVTQPVVAEMMAFVFTEDCRGLESIATAATVIARDGE